MAGEDIRKHKGQFYTRVAGHDPGETKTGVAHGTGYAGVDRVHGRGWERRKRVPSVEEGDDLAVRRPRHARLVERERRAVDVHRVHDHGPPIARGDDGELRRARHILEVRIVLADEERAMRDVAKLVFAAELDVDGPRKAGLLSEERGRWGVAGLRGELRAVRPSERVVDGRVTIEAQAQDAVSVCCEVLRLCRKEERYG